MIDMDRVNEITARLNTLQQRQADIMGELNKSMLIKALWPEAFDCGSVTTTWRHSKLQTVQEYNTAIARGVSPLEGSDFQITRADGESRRFPYDEVPELLRVARRKT